MNKADNSIVKLRRSGGLPSLAGRLRGLSGLLFFLSFFPLSLRAQTGGDSIAVRNITIEREYQPVIQDAGKINTLPYFTEPKIVKLTPSYTTDFSKPLHVGQNIHYLAAADLAYQRRKNKEGFARIAAGTGFNSLADFAFPLVKKPDMKLDFMLNHYGLFNAKAHSGTQAALAFDKKFRTLDFYAGLGGRHEYFKYYGHNFNSVNSITSLKEQAQSFGTYSYMPAHNLQHQVLLNDLAGLPADNTLWRFNANAGIRTSPAAEDLRYGIHINYDLFNSKNGITEQQLEITAGMDTEFFDNRLGIEVSSQNQFYTTKNSVLTDALKNYYVFSLNPYYSIEREEFDLRLGVKSSFSFAHGRGFSPSPDVRFEWRAVPRFLAVYAGASGSYRVNSMSRMYTENYFLNPDVMVDDTYTPLNFFAGIKLKPAAGLLLDAYINYQMVNNEYFFVNKEYRLNETPQPGFNLNDTLLYTNRFETIYSKARQLKIGGRISYNYHSRFSIQLSGAYNHWNVKDIEHAWHKPAWEMNISANMLVTPKLNIYADAALAGKRYAEIGSTAVEMKSKVDINLGASYTMQDWLSVFLKINNLLNSKYEQWYGCEVQGFNIMAGAAFNF